MEYCRTASVSSNSDSRVMTFEEANLPSASSLAAKRTEASIHSRDAAWRTSILSAFGKVENRGWGDFIAGEEPAHDARRRPTPSVEYPSKAAFRRALNKLTPR